MTELHNHLLKISGELGKAVDLEKIDIKTAGNLNAMLSEAINFIPCCTQLPTIIEVDFYGHLKCQIETTDKTPTILKAVNGYGQPVDCNKDKIRINEI